MGNFGSTLFGLLMFVTWAGLSLAVFALVHACRGHRPRYIALVSVWAIGSMGFYWVLGVQIIPYYDVNDILSLLLWPLLVLMCANGC